MLEGTEHSLLAQFSSGSAVTETTLPPTHTSRGRVILPQSQASSLTLAAFQYFAHTLF